MQANADFYRQVNSLFSSDAQVPELPWKKQPSQGHLLGRLMVDDGAPWMVDGAGVTIESDTRAFTKETATDSNGWFGAVDLVPDRYFVRLWRNGREFYRTPAREIGAGTTVRFDVQLRRADLEPTLPTLEATASISAPANGIVQLSGARLDGRVLAVVNGVAAMVFRNTENEASLILPNLAVERWRITLRQPGVESNVLELEPVEATPEIIGVRRVGDVLEVYGVGLGRVNEATSRPVLPVEALVNGQRMEILFAGGHAGQALYQVNVMLPASTAGGTVQLRMGTASSNKFTWQEARQPMAGAVKQARSRLLVLANLRRMSLKSFPRYQAALYGRPAGPRASLGQSN